MPLFHRSCRPILALTKECSNKSSWVVDTRYLAEDSSFGNLCWLVKVNSLYSEREGVFDTVPHHSQYFLFSVSRRRRCFVFSFWTCAFEDVVDIFCKLLRLFWEGTESHMSLMKELILITCAAVGKDSFSSSAVFRRAIWAIAGADLSPKSWYGLHVYVRFSVRLQVSPQEPVYLGDADCVVHFEISPFNTTLFPRNLSPIPNKLLSRSGPWIQ